MKAEAPALKSLIDRVEKLERQNRWMKRIGVTALVFASCVAVMGQANTNKVIEANAFHLLDDAGKLRADLSVLNLDSSRMTHLTFYDENRKPEVVLASSWLATGAVLRLLARGGTDNISLEAGSPSNKIVSIASLSIGTLDSSEKRGIKLSGGHVEELSVDGLWMYGSGGEFMVNTDNEYGPRLSLSDKEGYSSVLGKSDLVITKTGRKEQTPAASLVLFNKDDKVLWSAP